MTTLEFLKANREDIINMINMKLTNKTVKPSLKNVMLKVVEYSQLGCFDVINDEDDLNQIITYAVDEVSEEAFSNEISELMNGANALSDQREEVLKAFNKRRGY